MVVACTWHRVEEGVLCKMMDFSVLYFLFKKRKYPSVPVCSQFSKESRWELVQRSWNRQLQSSVEKADVRKTDASPRVLMREMVWLGRCGARLSILCQTSRDSFCNQARPPEERHSTNISQRMMLSPLTKIKKR